MITRLFSLFVIGILPLQAMSAGAVFRNCGPATDGSTAELNLRSGGFFTISLVRNGSTINFNACRFRTNTGNALPISYIYGIDCTAYKQPELGRVSLSSADGVLNNLWVTLGSGEKIAMSCR